MERYLVIILPLPLQNITRHLEITFDIVQPFMKFVILGIQIERNVLRTTGHNSNRAQMFSESFPVAFRKLHAVYKSIHRAIGHTLVESTR